MLFVSVLVQWLKCWAGRGGKGCIGCESRVTCLLRQGVRRELNECFCPRSRPRLRSKSLERMWWFQYLEIQQVSNLKGFRVKKQLVRT